MSVLNKRWLKYLLVFGVCLLLPIGSYGTGISFKKGRFGVDSLHWRADDLVASDRNTMWPSGFSIGAGSNSTETVNTDFGDSETPNTDWAQTANITTADATIFKKGSASLSLTVGGAPADGNGADCALATGNQDWSNDESFGMWMQCSITTEATWWVLEITDDGGAHEVAIPAVPADTWTWVEVDVTDPGGGGNADKDVISSLAIDLTATGATAMASEVCYFDGMWKWDAAQEMAIGLDIEEDGLSGVNSVTTGTGGNRTPIMEVEDTDFFVHYEAGNDFLVPITNLSNDSLWGYALEENTGTGTCSGSTATILNSGPEVQTVVCTDAATSVFEGVTRAPRGYNGQPLTFDLSVIQTADEQETFSVDVDAQCCESRAGVVDNGYGTSVEMRVNQTTGDNYIDTVTSAPVTPSGTCSGGDYIFWRMTVDATETTASMNTLHVLGVEMKYGTRGDDHEVIAVSRGYDFTNDDNCQGLWIYFSDDLEASSVLDRCTDATTQDGSNDMTWNGAAWVLGTAPAGSPNAYDAADLSGGAGEYYIATDAGGEMNAFDAAEFTMACWINRDENVANQWIFGKNDVGNFELRTNNGGTGSLIGRVQAGQESSAGSVAPLNTWTHVAIRFTAAGAATELFANGQDACAGACEAATAPTGNTNSLALGATHLGASEYNGELYECVYFDRGLTDDEIEELFLCGVEGNADGTYRDLIYGGATCADIANACCD
jgi:hypothetical protein